MILRLIRWIASWLPHRLITGEDNTPYLSRFRIVGWMPGSTWRWPFSVYLHHFHRPDLDDAHHNHPWSWAVSLILTGGYTEEVPLAELHGGHLVIGERRLRPGRLNFLRSDSYHCVKELHGEVWTLFIVGPKAHSWGFWVPGRGHVPWRERLAERGIEVGP